MSPFSRRAALLLPLLLAACGGLPRPFQGHPGVEGARLAQPPPARLAVLMPEPSLMPALADLALVAATTDALVAQEIPAVPGPASPGDWRLRIGAEPQGENVLPTFEVQDPAGESQGVSQGAPVPAAAWSAGAPETVNQVAAQAAPGIAALLSRIEAARLQSDPNSLVNRPARVVVDEVTGAPGDGNQELTRQMREQLPKQGAVVQDTMAGADFVVDCEVKAVPIAGNQTRVEIQWIVRDTAGDEKGRVVQLNEVPNGTLDRLWGDVALVVAQEAAGGIKDVILNLTGARKPDASQTGAAQAGAAQAGAAQAGAGR